MRGYFCSDLLYTYYLLGISASIGGAYLHQFAILTYQKLYQIRKPTFKTPTNTVVNYHLSLS